MSSENNSKALRNISESRVAKTNSASAAAKWNKAQYHRLGLALKKDPEANMIDMLSTDYPKKLQSFKSSSKGSSRCQPDGDLSYISDPRSKLVTTEPFTIIHELSAEVKQLLNPGDLSKALLDLLHRGDILFQTACVMVLKIGESIVVKITQADTSTEYRSLCYLQQHLPIFPAPRAHGLLQLGAYNLLFTSFIPGTELEKAWPQMDEVEKRAVCSNLDEVISLLRSIPFSHGTPLVEWVERVVRIYVGTSE
ncbi:hypothetical protein FCULG_00012976 [Fusarium culmorum]|uniref:Aminoglycoside phosphotransferase domain-containing protein n=1 Tax=Fusarium culmorum TaxID=5516 RepID=A0A2T4GEQ1_FUSCU|nr:hypothetical protein FCULG_00012976 [Fusarium culmorum]